ncbi:MAG: septum formation initiator family protein [Rikenellaceae bacterium]|nr:septum formation initiator family protein [Rikenellaceae bacterium]
MWKTILKKYRFTLILLVIFLVVVAFIDKNNAVDNIRLNRKIKDLETQREFYLKKIQEDSLMLEKLKDPAFLEKYARENFYMRRKGEEVYIVR